MKAGVTEQRLAAAVTAVSLAASITLIIANPNKGVSDAIDLTETVSATTIDPYFPSDYVVNTTDYASDQSTVTV